jgi:hypothetical protein
MTPTCLTAWTDGGSLHCGWLPTAGRPTKDTRPCNPDRPRTFFRDSGRHPSTVVLSTLLVAGTI